jgi:hypothetical protein
MEVFFYRYRKILFAGSFFSFFYFFYQVYGSIELVNLSRTGEGIGTLINAFISLFVSIYLFINVRKATKAFKEEATAEANSDKHLD